MQARPNVLLIVIDQFRADLLSGGFEDIVKLPNLRALMGDATSFENHFSVTAPCGPARVSLLTGQYTMNHHAVRNGTPLRHDTPNLASEARKFGYDPLLFGYSDTTHDPRVVPADDPRLRSYEEVMPGFKEIVRMRQDTGDQVWRDHLAAHGIEADGFDIYRPAGDQVNDPAIYPADLSDTAFLTDQFLQHMSTVDEGWFAALTYIRPHQPYVAPAPYNSMYAPDGMPNARQRTGEDENPFINASVETKTPDTMVVGFPSLESSDETTATLRAIYLGLATEVDHHIGRVIDWLKDTGQYDNTVLVVTADHGDMLGDFDLWGKTSYHDCATQTPLILRAPGKTQPRSVSEFTESIDVMPTILDLIGAETPTSVDGYSLIPLLDEKNVSWREHTFSEFDFGDPIRPSSVQRHLGLHSDHCNFAVLRTKDFRLVHFGGELPQLLFAANDEARNLADAPNMLPTVLDLSRKMLSHRMAHADGTFANMMVTTEGMKTGTY